VGSWAWFPYSFCSSKHILQLPGAESAAEWVSARSAAITAFQLPELLSFPNWWFVNGTSATKPEGCSIPWCLSRPTTKAVSTDMAKQLLI